MDPLELYESFSARFGQDRAARFMLVLHRQSVAMKRLYYWQEQMLADFSGVSAVSITTLEEALDSFRICHVHGLALMPDKVPVRYGTMKPASPEALDHADRTYPFANLTVGGPCWVEETTHREVDFCQGCRAAYANEHA